MGRRRFFWGKDKECGQDGRKRRKGKKRALNGEQPLHRSPPDYRFRGDVAE